MYFCTIRMLGIEWHYHNRPEMVTKPEKLGDCKCTKTCFYIKSVKSDFSMIQHWEVNYEVYESFYCLWINFYILCHLNDIVIINKCRFHPILNRDGCDRIYVLLLYTPLGITLCCIKGVKICFLVVAKRSRIRGYFLYR